MILTYLRRISILVACFTTTSFFTLHAKKQKYPSLLWEITGNGLKQPSYLFGTMHVSNKMVFHLNDSFYNAIGSSDVVAIELDPIFWQTEMPRFQKQSEDFRYYHSTYYTDYLTEKSYQETNVNNIIKAVLRYEPEVNNDLLYRTQTEVQNFQEDTYLDLYIYQTGKKLGKLTTGVETFMGMQRMVMEAYIDMMGATEKSKNNNRSYDVDVSGLLQDAYRRGDLDALDSLNAISETSDKFMEKFLYQRNVIQSNSMDSIMKHQRLFVAVGAAHLPGSRGVIELLRAKGYQLRPVLMQDRDALQKAHLDSMHVPVTFYKQYADDSFFTIEAPGKLNAIQTGTISMKNYADMGNGSYYLVSRIKTNNFYTGYDEQLQLKSLDSMLYENIPGSILSKNVINKNGYDGYDITNRTKTGDIQRYQIIATPAEVVIFKMGGKENYVYGSEADTFFKSIVIKERTATPMWQTYSPYYGGFSVKLPTPPQTFYTIQDRGDRLPAWKYEATDPSTGDQYAIVKKTIYSFDFVDPDSFETHLPLESIVGDDIVEKEIYRKEISKNKSNPCFEIKLKTKNKNYITARSISYGAQRYMIMIRSDNENSDASIFFNSFNFESFAYPPATSFTDHLLHFTVQTPIKPIIDNDILDMMTYIKDNTEKIQASLGNYNSGISNTYANFMSEATGEVIVVNSYNYPDYYYIKDSVKAIQDAVKVDSSMIVYKSDYKRYSDGTDAYLLEYGDTGSVRKIRKLLLLKGNIAINASTQIDSTLPESSFITTFFNTLKVTDDVKVGIFTSKLSAFWKDYYSTDTTLHKKAVAAITSVSFGKEGFPQVVNAMEKLSPNNKDYIGIKTKFITALGTIDDSSVTPKVAEYLKKIYLNAGDTTLIQNSVLNALATQKTLPATQAFKDLILQDPPAFEEEEDYSSLFYAFNDTLALAATLYPDILNLSNIQEFKDPIRTLLARLVDSHYIKPDIYENAVGNIFFDAKLTLKKMQNASENAADNGNEDYGYTKDFYYSYSFYNISTLLIPYYDSNPNIAKYFDKLLQSTNKYARIDAAISMLKNNKKIPDSLFVSLASAPKIRLYLYNHLKEGGLLQHYPERYNYPQLLARDMFEDMIEDTDTIQFYKSKEIDFKGKKANTYFFKYKTEDDDKWKLGMMGLIKNNKGEWEQENDLYYTTYKEDVMDTSLNALMDQQLKKALIISYPSGEHFYTREASPPPSASGM